MTFLTINFWHRKLVFGEFLKKNDMQKHLFVSRIMFAIDRNPMYCCSGYRWSTDLTEISEIFMSDFAVSGHSCSPVSASSLEKRKTLKGGLCCIRALIKLLKLALPTLCSKLICNFLTEHEIWRPPVRRGLSPARRGLFPFNNIFSTEIQKKCLAELITNIHWE